VVHPTAFVGGLDELLTSTLAFPFPRAIHLRHRRDRDPDRESSDEDDEEDDEVRVVGAGSFLLHFISFYLHHHFLSNFHQLDGDLHSFYLSHNIFFAKCVVMNHDS
jgi:hypothetical protein